MEPNTCSYCLARVKSLTNHGMAELLQSDLIGTDACPHEKEFRIAAMQYRLRKPQWWVVGGKPAIPMWVIEQMRNQRCPA
jgi:hypothetical protein